MYSEIPHIFFSSISNPVLIKDDKEDLNKCEIVKRPTSKFQIQSEIESTESLSSSSRSHSREEKEENNDQEKEERRHESVIEPKQSDSEASSPQLKVQEEDEEEDGFRTPTCLDHRIPAAKQCPPAPRKTKPSLKRKAPNSGGSPCNCRHPLDLSKEVELLLFPTQHVPLSDSHQSTKKVRREQPK